MDGLGQLSLSDIACLRGGKLLFRGVSASLGPGDAMILAGSNGVGKSSLLRVVAGLLPKFAGEIKRTGRIALADENHALDSQLPLRRALKFWAGLDGGDVDSALSALGLQHLADVPVRFLSTGQKRRATLARVIVSNAAIWLLDEPGNGLDAVSIGQFGDVMAAHRARGGIILAASHQHLPLPEARMFQLESAI